MPKLLFADSRVANCSFELAEETISVGRAKANRLVIGDPSVSSFHAEILVNGPEVIVRDLGSRNGTVVDGKRLINAQAQLKHGQTVRFGAVHARLELDLPEATTVGLTAIHDYRRAVREMQKLHSEPPAACVLGSASQDQTVISTPSGPPEVSPAATAAVSETPAAPRRWMGIFKRR